MVEKDRTRLYHSAVRRLRFLIAIAFQVCCANILHVPAASYTSLRYIPLRLLNDGNSKRLFSNEITVKPLISLAVLVIGSRRDPSSC